MPKNTENRYRLKIPTSTHH